MADNIIKVFKVQVDTSTGELKINGITSTIKQAQNEFNKFDKIAQKAAKSNETFIDKSGLAGAAVVEIGRTISDANYGFAAMANNISQLSTLLITLISTTGSASNAWKELKKAFSGPLGLIVIFQIVVTLLEKAAKASKKMGDSVKQATDGLNSQIIVANEYVKILEDVNTSEEKRAGVIQELEKLIPTLKDQEIDYGKELDIVKQKIIDYSLAQASRLQMDKLVQENSEVLSQRRRIENIQEIESEEERQKAIENFLELEGIALTEQVEKYDTFGGRFTTFVKRGQEEINKDFTDFANSVEKESTPIIEKINDLANNLDKAFVKPDKGKLTKGRREFIAKELSFAEDILKSEDRIAKKVTKNQFDRLEQEEELQKELAKIKFDEYKKREIARANAIKDPKDRKKAIEKANEAIGMSLASLSEYEIQLTKETQDKKTQIIGDAIVKQFELATQLNAKEREAILSFEASMATGELNKLDAEKRLEDEKLKNKLDALDIEKQKRIENEEFYGDILIKEEQALAQSKRAKEKIDKKEQKAKLAIANETADAIVGLAGESSAVGKAVSIAMAIMNTKEAITEALAGSPPPFNYIQAAAVGAFGLKQVRDIMSTKLPAGAPSGTGGAGASMSVSAPDFNVVGQGAGSQLAGVVGSRFGEPIKAYVLSSDVSSAQELDRKIDSTATIG